MNTRDRIVKIARDYSPAIADYEREAGEIQIERKNCALVSCSRFRA